MKPMQFFVGVVTGVVVVFTQFNAMAEQQPAAKQQFEFLTSLNGDWKLSPQTQQEGKSTEDKHVKPLLGSDTVAMRFKLVGKGSTVQENLLPGTKKEMATMYHCDDFGNCNQVIGMHFCAKQNQPKLIASPGQSSTSLALTCDMNTPLCNSSEEHVHAISHELSAGNSHLKTTYSIFKDGKLTKQSVYHFDRIQ